MTLVKKRIKGRHYYYSFLSYFLIDKPKSFSKYIGLTKPTKKELRIIENAFKGEIISKVSGSPYSSELIGKDSVIKTLLFRELFDKKYHNLSGLMRRKYDIDSTIQFTLTTLTTEEVDVDIEDVERAFEKKALTQKEKISQNMLKAVDLIKSQRSLDKNYLLNLHRMIMANFKTKNPGMFRTRQVYLHRRGEDNKTGGLEIAYRPPDYRKIEKLVDKFISWYISSDLNPVEKAAMAHYNLYRIHPFLDGNKRMCRLIFNKTLLESRFQLINISFEKYRYFDALVESVENNTPQPFVDFALKQYFMQVKRFLVEK